MYFDELDLNDNVLDSLYDMHFDTCTPVQERCIPEILKGNDILGIAQTGTGKTAAYLLPILSKLDDGGYPEDAINCLIMAPTRELAQQIDQAMQGFSYYLDKVSSIAVYGGNDGTRYDQELKSLTLGADVVIATPGRLISHMSMGNVDLGKVSFFVLDEADRMLDMGFSDDILKISKHLPATCQTIMFSATMPEKIEQLAKTLLKNPSEVKIAVSKPAEKIKQSAYVCHEGQKIGVIKDIFKAGNLKRVIIFSGSKQKVKQISGSLALKGIKSGEMHSDLDQAQRDEMMFNFKSGKIDVLVATDILSRGIDIDDIEMVINYDVPRDTEDYVHRIGRTARADRHGCAITLVSERDIRYFMQIEEFLGTKIEKAKLPEDLGEAPEYKLRKATSRKGDGKPRGKSRKRTEGNGEERPKRNRSGNSGKGTYKKPMNQDLQSDETASNKPVSQDAQTRENVSVSHDGEKQANRKPRKKTGDKVSARKNPPAKDTIASDEKSDKSATTRKKRHKKHHGDRPAKPNVNQTSPSSKYNVGMEIPVKKQEETGIKKLVGKTLKWLKSLKN